MVATLDAGVNLASERACNTVLSSSPLLPFLLLSLARQKHTPDTSYEIKKNYDYIVVGAGASGSVVASRLSEIPCVNVLLLEAGPPPPKLTDVMGLYGDFLFSDIDWQYKTVPQKFTGRGQRNRQINFPLGKTLGGSDILSAELYVRGNRKDYDDWAAMGAKGWSYKDVLPYFKKMEDNRDPEYIANGFHGVHGPITVMRPRYNPEIREPLLLTGESMGYKIVDPNAQRQTGFYDEQVDVRNGQRCSVAKGYLVPAENRTNLDIVANAFVTKIIIKNRQAVGVRFDVGRKSFTVKANREVIVSAGTVKTAQLLMLSGVGPKKELEKFNIPVHADLPVGYNFHDHPGSTVEFTLSPRIMRYTDKIRNPKNIKQFINKRTGPLSGPYVTVLAFLDKDEINVQKDYPDLLLFFGESSYENVQRNSNLRPEVFHQVFAPYLNHSTMTCIVESQHPRSRGYVKLRSANPYDQPLIDPNYLADPRDADDLVEALKMCKKIGTSYYMRKVGARPFQTLYPGCERYASDDDEYFRCQIETVLLSNYHPVGTAKMGDPRDPTTVVDPELRVKKIKGLRVVDNSIIPKITSGNTGVPAMMIGEKASDIIKSTIDCEDHEWDYNRRPYDNQKFKSSPVDYEYDGDENEYDNEYDDDEDELVLSPKVKDDSDEGYDNVEDELDNNDDDRRTFSYPEVKSGEVLVDNNRKQSLFRTGSNYQSLPVRGFQEYVKSGEVLADNNRKQSLFRSGSNYQSSPVRGFQEYVPPLAVNRNRYFDNANFNNRKVGVFQFSPFNSEMLSRSTLKRR